MSDIVLAAKVLPFKRTSAFWKKKKIVDSATFDLLDDFAKGEAGRLAGIYQTEFVREIYDSLGKAIAIPSARARLTIAIACSTRAEQPESGISGT